MLSLCQVLDEMEEVVIDELWLITSETTPMKIRNYTHEEANVLVDILEDRHRKGSVIVTSQVDPKGWLKLFEDPIISEAIVSRLANPSQWLILTDGDYREKLQKALLAGKTLEQEKVLNYSSRR